jgi:hypothetical protein
MLYASARPITMSHYADTSQKLQKSHGSFILARDFAHILIAQLLEPLCSVIHSALVSPLPTASWPYYKGCQIEDYCLYTGLLAEAVCVLALILSPPTHLQRKDN